MADINNNLIEVTKGLVLQIADYFQKYGIPFDRAGLEQKIASTKLEEADIASSIPISYDQRSGIIKINSSGVENYDISYYMTTFLLMMLGNYVEELQGIRTGLCAGTAADIVHNCVKETETEVIAGVDLFESLRAGLADLSAKITPDKAIALCAARSIEEFMNLAGELGIENPKKFLGPYNYLALNAGNLSEVQMAGLTEELTKNNSTLTPQDAKVIG